MDNNTSTEQSQAAHEHESSLQSKPKVEKAIFVPDGNEVVYLGDNPDGSATIIHPGESSPGLKPIYAVSKNLLKFLALLIFILGLSTGCKAFTNLQNAKPTAFEEHVYNIKTNVVTVLETNTVTQVSQVTVTNPVTQVTSLTNITTVTQQLVPTQQTNYDYSVAPATSAGVTATGAIANLAVPGLGTIVSGALAGLLGIWGAFKSKQATTAQSVNETLSQAIATAQQVIGQVSPSASASFNTWLSQHKADSDLASEIAGVVDQYVDPTAAHGTAISIVSQLTTPLAPPTPKTAPVGIVSN